MNRWNMGFNTTVQSQLGEMAWFMMSTVQREHFKSVAVASSFELRAALTLCKYHCEWPKYQR
jgi:hypothetical protein